MAGDIHHTPRNLSDWFALKIVKALRGMADFFFAERYGNRAVVLETIAGVPGMVGGMLQHLKSLRRMEDDQGKIKTLLDEAENERMHLMTFIEIAQPTLFERMLIITAQGVYFTVYALLYMVSPRTCHRIVGYMEEEAIFSYTHYLQEVESGRIKDVPAPQIALDYWEMRADATLVDLIQAVRADEQKHRDVNHRLANGLPPSSTG